MATDKRNINRILVPLPADTEAIPLLKYATSLARELEAELSLVHVCSTEESGLGVPTRCTHVQEEITWDQLLYNVRIWQIKEYPDSYEVLPEFTVEYGETIPTILDSAARKGADLILMGTGGLASQVNKTFGSVAAGVVQKARVPVWVVPTETPFQTINNVVYAAQFEAGEVLRVEGAQKISAQLGAKLTCIHVMGDQLEVDSLEELPFAVEMDAWVDKSVEDGLLHYINQHAVDLLVMATHAFSDAEHLLSHTREVMFHTSTPLLVLPISQ